MKKYKVMLEGKNFWMPLEGKVRQVGFYTTRFVEADNPKDAELKAVQLIRNDNKLSAAQNEKDDPPMIYMDSLEELESFEGLNLPGTGYAFYYEDTSRH